jgi:hypothetical protein
MAASVRLLPDRQDLMITIALAPLAGELRRARGIFRERPRPAKDVRPDLQSIVEARYSARFSASSVGARWNFGNDMLFRALAMDDNEEMLFDG